MEPFFSHSMASKHFTPSSFQTQVQSRDRDPQQGFGSQVYQYEKGNFAKKSLVDWIKKTNMNKENNH